MTTTLTRLIRSQLAYHGDKPADLADLLGIAPRTVQDRLAGRTDWRWLELARIARRYPALCAFLVEAAADDAELELEAEA